jgi:formylmethanofuran dehydrogenase subunit E
MNMFQAVGIVTAGTIFFQIADIGKSVYLEGRDLSETQRIQSKKTSFEIDRSNRELAKDYAFLHNNPNLEEPMYRKLKHRE